MHFVSKKLFKSTGNQLLMEDVSEEEIKKGDFSKTILNEMCEENYLKPLQNFAHKTLFSVSHFDILVPYCSSAIKSYNPHPIPL